MKWIKDKIKWLIFLIFGGGIVLAATQIPAPEVNGITLETSNVIIWDKPTTDQEWADDVKKESLDLKFDYQLTDMKISLEKKLPLHEKDLDKLNRCPDCIRWELEENFKQMFNDSKIAYDKQLEDKTLQQWIDEEFIEQTTNTTWEVEKVRQSIERIDNEIRLRDKGFLTIIDTIPAGEKNRLTLGNTRSPLGTTYYIDADCGTPGDGTTPTCNGDGDDSFNDFLDFTESARSVDDIAIARRGTTAAYDDSTDLNFTSSGTRKNPIVLEADYDDVWGDFTTAGQTATLTFGSKIVTFAGDISGDLAANDWIYETTEDNREFSYEVASISGGSNEIVTLFLPYKGDISGAGKTIEIMPNAPIHGSLSDSSLSVLPNSDDFWQVQGIHFRSTDSNGVLDASVAEVWSWKDIIFEGNGISVICIDATHNSIFRKNRITKCSPAFISPNTFVYIYDSLLDGAGAADALQFFSNANYLPYETEFVNWSGVLFDIDAGYAQGMVKARNLIKDASTFSNNPLAFTIAEFFIEDYDNTIGDNRQFNNFGTTVLGTIFKSTTIPVRSGGGDTSIEVTPNTQLSIDWEHSKIKLFEYPIYTDTTSRDYQVFFRSGDGTPFSSSPTADELWIECEYWGHASNNFRRITKSVGTVDFTTDADFDQSLTVTCEPSQEGILYLRGWYAKTKEGETNQFFVDIQPVITDS